MPPSDDAEIELAGRDQDRAPWKILIVDDDPEVHEVTRMVLAGFEFEQRGLAFLHARSADEARPLLAEHSDLAVVLLDVVMESERAGLDLVHYIRRELDNHFVRIVLRTGQPGEAPEREVIARYDINDYKDKTELTADRLFTTLYATLRAYRDVMIIEANKRGLEKVIEASAQIFSHHERHQFASAVLEQIVVLLGVDRGALYCQVADRSSEPEMFRVGAATGPYRHLVGRPLDHELPARIAESLKSAWEAKANVIGDDHYVLHFTDSNRSESLLYVGETYRLQELDHKLLKVFCTNVSIAYENLHLHRQTSEAQLDMLCLLAGVAESRSLETARHVSRVGRLSALLAEASGMQPSQVEMLRMAAPLHDIGKIGIPDAVLNKAGPHTAEEQAVMRRHVELGAELLSISGQPLFRMAARVAREHHENWDGSGYPNGLKGEEISLAGRIVALADVCDALGSHRCYKSAWGPEEVREHIANQRGRKFDPGLVDLLLEHWDEVMALREVLPDQSEVA